MASSKRLRPDDLAAHVATLLLRHELPRRQVALALSGGLDSVVLFHLLLDLRQPLGFDFSAFHVHHGLSPRADRWEAFCAGLCAAHGIPFEARRVDVSRKPGESLEAAAREARYRALASASADLLLLAQHLDDQAETLLLQLLRGAGAKGLAAMPEARRSGDKILLRPLLDVPRDTLREYAKVRGLAWEEDESNEDVGFDRNFLRHEVFPVLERRFPAYRQTLGRASRHLAETAHLLDELAQLDGRQGIRDGMLDGELLRQLSFPRAKNLLRHYLAQRQVPLPDTSRLEEAVRQLREAGRGPTSACASAITRFAATGAGSMEQGAPRIFHRKCGLPGAARTNWPCPVSACVSSGWRGRESAWRPLPPSRSRFAPAKGGSASAPLAAAPAAA